MAKTKKDKTKEQSESWFSRLKQKSRVSIYDHQNFELKRSFMLSVWNLIVVSMFLIIIVVAVTWFVIAYTPLRQSIPGYPNISEIEKIKMQDIENLKKLEEFEHKQEINAQYNKTLEQILNEELPDDPSILLDSLAPLDSAALNSISFKISKEDSLLRLKVEANEKYGFNANATGASKELSDNISGVFFFTPLMGEVSNEVDVKKGHYGIDIKAPKDEAVKSTLDGTVIYTDWSPENGHVIHIQHSHNLVSVYKHNSFLLKKQGDLVKSGEPIAIVGNSGSLSLGTHLHFELWYGGVTLDPLKFISFK